MRRVPLDFDWPLNVVWQGYLRPDELDLPPCPVCTNPSDHDGHGSAAVASEIGPVTRPHQIAHGHRTVGADTRCPRCGDRGHVGTPGQVAAYERWRETEPPTGRGWQLWETTSEGSPISPVFAAADDLIAWMSHPDRGPQWLPAAVAAKFVAEGSAPSLVGSSSGGDGVPGAEYVGFHADLSDDGETTTDQ